jgi:hypothetical protein
LSTQSSGTRTLREIELFVAGKKNYTHFFFVAAGKSQNAWQQ